MKTIYVLLATLFLVGSSYAGDIDTVVTSRNHFQDTLTATIDTVDVSFDNSGEGLNHFSFTVFSTTGADTIDVYTQSADGLNWVKIGMMNLTSGSATALTQILSSTTPSLYEILDPSPLKIRFLCLDAGSASSVVIYGGKKIE